MRETDRREEIWEGERGERRERRERRERGESGDRGKRGGRGDPDIYYISETDKQAKNGKKGLVKLHSIYIGISRPAKIKSAHIHIGYYTQTDFYSRKPLLANSLSYGRPDMCLMHSHL